MYPEIPYDGLTWPITQHAGVISESVLRGLLEACSLCAGKRVNPTAINAYLVDNGILTANFRADSQQVDAWRDYQQILSELGLIFSTAVSNEVLLTPISVAFIDGTISFEELLTLQLFKYQYPNGHKTQISPSLRNSFPEGTFNYESVAHMQALNGIQVRPAVLTWTVLMQLYQQGADPSVSVDEMQRYLVRATKNSDARACTAAIVASRAGTFSYEPLARARRNMQDWMKLLGATPLFNLSKNRLCLSTYSVDNIDELWDMGVVVVAAAGNYGPAPFSVTVPGISRKIITVGSFDDIRSGKGPTDCCIVKPEILAPGHDIISLGTRDGTYVRKTGTSMATPIVSGAIALLLEKNPNMRPEAVKLALYNTCDRAGDSHKGSWGIINVDKLVGIL